MRLFVSRAFGIFALALLIGLPAAAYIPDSSFMLGRLAKQRAKMGYRRLKVTMTCDRDGASRTETLYLKVPGRVRRERAEDVVDVCHRGRCWRKAPGHKPQRLPAWRYLPYLYFVEFDAGSSRYLGLLKSLGVDLAVDTLARFHSRIAVVYGGKNWERDRPQFWMDKDNFLPLRLMFLDDKHMMDIQWIGWGSREAGNWFPEELELHRDGDLVEKCAVSEVKSGVSMPDALFEIE